MIRKTLLLGLLVFAFVAVGLPALMGLYLEREFDALAARFARPGLTRVADSHFERGWFSSNARIRLELDEPLCDGPPCAGVTLHTTIYHGPIAFGAPVDPERGFKPGLGVAVTRIDPAALWPRLVFEPALAPLRVVTQVGLVGRARSRLTIAGQRVDISRARALAHVESAPVTGRLSAALGGGPVAAVLEAPRLRIVGEDGGQLAWRGLQIRIGDFDAPASALAAGGSLQLESLRAADSLGGAVLLQSLSGQWQPLPADNAGLSGRLTGRIGRAVINNNPYGPLHLVAQVGGMRLDAWRALFAQLAALRDADSGGIDPEARATLYAHTLPTLLAGAPHIDIQRLRLTTPQGDIRVKLRVDAPEQMRKARLLADVISQLDLEFSARVPTSIARDITVQVMLASGRSPYAIEESDIDAALAELVDEHLIESLDKGTAYRLRLRVDDGRLRLNGRNQIGWQAMIDQFEAARERL